MPEKSWKTGPKTEAVKLLSTYQVRCKECSDKTMDDVTLTYKHVKEKHGLDLKKFFEREAFFLADEM